jgi:large subunit ribosomal protein L22
MRGYTHPSKSGETVARARGLELTISPKKTYEVLNAIRGRGLEEARQILNDAAEGLQAIPFRRYNQETAHHRGAGPGRFPKKVAEAVLEILQNAEANAEYEGMDTDALIIVTAASARGRIQKANMPRAQGRATAWNEQTTNIEIVLGERAEN